MGTTPTRNLPPESTPWGVWVEKELGFLRDSAARRDLDSTNSGKSQNATTGALGAQIQALAALTTTSRNAASFNTGTTPGDSTWRWVDHPAGPLTITLVSRTGRILLTIGSGQSTINPGNSTATASISVAGSTASGWSYPIQTVESRVFATVAVSQIGVPLIVSAPVSVPPGEVVTLTMKFGIWSSSTTTLASANFGTPYITAQVIN